MSAKRLLAIGLNAVSKKAYGGWDGRLLACEADARSHLAIAEERGFESISSLLTKKATRAAVEREIRRLAKQTEPGDLAVITYSGHGGQVRDTSGDEAAADRKDECPCLYDGLMLDDELRALLSLFVEGSTVVYISDSCHSETQVRAFADLGLLPLVRPKTAPRYAIKAALEKLDPRDGASDPPPEAKARILSFAACRDDQLALDGDKNGLFTGAFVKTLPAARSWRHHRELVNALTISAQEPCLSGPDDALDLPPFEITA